MKNGIKNLGYANGWQNGTPEIVRQCHEKGHPLEVANVGRCVTKYTCKVCEYTYEIDSSD